MTTGLDTGRSESLRMINELTKVCLLNSYMGSSHMQNTFHPYPQILQSLFQTQSLVRLKVQGLMIYVRPGCGSSGFQDP